MEYKLLKIIKCNDLKHRLEAHFFNKDTNKKKIVKFGLYGGNTFIDHKDNLKKENYIKRHQVRENFNNFLSRGALSRWILWNTTTLRESIKDFKNKFNL